VSRINREAIGGGGDEQIRRQTLMFIDVMIDCIAAQLSRVFSITLQGIPRRQDQMPVAETVELASSKPLH